MKNNAFMSSRDALRRSLSSTSINRQKNIFWKLIQVSHPGMSPAKSARVDWHCSGEARKNGGTRLTATQHST